jgi:hypothetical protein
MTRSEGSTTSGISRADFERFRKRQRRLQRVMWLIVGLAAYGCFIGIGAVSSQVASGLLVVSLTLTAYEVIRRWNRRQWLRQFPELAHIDFEWRVDTD